MSYRRQYHCFLCSSLYVGHDLPYEFADDEDTARNALTDEDRNRRFYIHYCDDGGIGAGTLAGYRKVTTYDT